MSTIVRRPSLRVRVNGRDLAGVFAARVTFSFAMRTSQAEVRLAAGPEVAPWDWIEIALGASPSTLRHRFSGYIVAIERELYPREVLLICRGPLVRAELVHGQATDTEPDGIDLANSGAGQTDQAMIEQVLAACGVPYAAIGGTGRTLGTIADDQFFWGPEQSGMSVIESLDEICLGYRTYTIPAGTTVRTVVSTVPPDSVALTLREGVDVERGSVRVDVLEIVNEVTVTGYDDAQYTASATSPFLPPGVDTIAARLSNPKIERELESDPGAGLSCEAVARWQLEERNRRVHVVRLTTPRDDLLVPGMAVGLQAPSRLGEGTPTEAGRFWVQEVVTEVDERGAFSQHLVLVGSESSVVPDPGRFGPIADFTLLVDQERVVVAGVAQACYVVSCQSTSVPGSAPLASWSWTATGGSPASGSGETLTTVYSSIAGKSITLQVTDSAGRTASLTRSVEQAAQEQGVTTRRLAIAAQVQAEAWDGLQYRTASPPAGPQVTVAANGPLWAAGSYLLRSPNYLGTAPTASQPLGSGTTITAIWVETDVDASRVAVGGSDGRIALSSDGGATWTVRTGPRTTSVLRVILSRFVSGEVHVLYADSYHVSSDGGATWRLVRAAAAGQQFRDLCLSHTRNVIASSVSGAGSPLEVAEDGTPFSFPSLSPAVTDVYAVTADIASDRFYCYDSAGRTFRTATSGGTTMTRGADLPAPGQAQVRGLWRDGAIPGLLYLANGTAGLYKSVDGLATAGGYYQLRAPGVDGASASAVYRMVGADGLLLEPAIPATTIQSAAGTGKILNLWNGTTNNPPPAGWQSLGYNDSSWGTPVAASSYAYQSPPSQPVWTSSVPSPDYTECLVRHVFSLPAGRISSAVLTIKCDDKSRGAWLNNVWLHGSTTARWEDQAVIEVSELLVAGGQNILAVWGRDDPAIPGPGNRAWISYRLEVR